MGKIGSLALGIVTAIGGFIDMGELVTCSQAGARYRFALVWTVVVGVLGIIIYADTAGRVAIASGRSLFDVIRERLGVHLGLIPLAGALVLQIITGLTYLVWYLVAAVLITLILWFASFSFVENAAALLGLAIVVFVVAALKLTTPWDQV